MPTRREIQDAAAALGITVPYHSRVVGDRIEFYPRGGQVLCWPPPLEPADVHVELAAGSKAQVYRVAAKLGIRGRSTMNKAQLLKAIRIVQELETQE